MQLCMCAHVACAIRCRHRPPVFRLLHPPILHGRHSNPTARVMWPAGVCPRPVCTGRCSWGHLPCRQHDACCIPSPSAVQVVRVHALRCVGLPWDDVHVRVVCAGRGPPPRPLQHEEHAAPLAVHLVRPGDELPHALGVGWQRGLGRRSAGGLVGRRLACMRCRGVAPGQGIRRTTRTVWVSRRGGAPLAEKEGHAAHLKLAPWRPSLPRHTSALMPNVLLHRQVGCQPSPRLLRNIPLPRPRPFSLLLRSPWNATACICVRAFACRLHGLCVSPLLLQLAEGRDCIPFCPVLPFRSRWAVPRGVRVARGSKKVCVGRYVERSRRRCKMWCLLVKAVCVGAVLGPSSLTHLSKATRCAQLTHYVPQCARHGHTHTSPHHHCKPLCR